VYSSSGIFFLLVVELKKLIPLIVLTVILAGCTDVVRPTAERGIRNALTSYIGPAKEYKVRIDGSGGAIISGHISHLHIDGTGVSLKQNLIIDAMTVDMDNVRYSPESRRIKSIGNTVFSASLSEDSLNRYIAGSQKGDSKLNVKFADGKALVTLAAIVGGIRIPISVAGRPTIEGTDKVNFVIDNSDVDRLPIPAFLTNKLLEKLNPILDLSKMRFPVTLTDISVRDGVVVISGQAVFKQTAQ
jgi:hypothetical protein